MSMSCQTQHAPEPVTASSQFSLMEMNEVEYLQHIIQSHMDAQVTETDSPAFSLSDDPVSAQDSKMLQESETTPVSGAEVPGSVLDRVQCAEEEERTDVRHRRGQSPPARVCLEKRFLSVLCHSTSAPGISTHAQIEEWNKPDQMVKIQGTYPYEGHLLKTGGQQSEPIIPTELSWSFRVDKASESVMRAPFVIYTDDQQTNATLKNDDAVCPIKHVRTRALRQGSENLKPCAKRVRTRPLMDRTQRKEVHNRKERDRRRRIRLCCDELNLLVPFCYSDTDKATTLQWTTAFLKYIQEIHGDCLKQDFQRTFCGKTGLRLKPSCVPVAHHLEPCQTLTEPERSSSHS